MQIRARSPGSKTPGYLPSPRRPTTVGHRKTPLRARTQRPNRRSEKHRISATKNKSAPAARRHMKNSLKQCLDFQVRTGRGPPSTGSESTFTWKPPQILPKAAVDCTHEHRGWCLPEEKLVEIISRLSVRTASAKKKTEVSRCCSRKAGESCPGRKP